MMIVEGPKVLFCLALLSIAAFAQAQRPRLVVQMGHAPGFVRFIRDGKSLLSIGSTIKLWDVRTGSELRTQQLVDGESVAISYDGNTFAVEGPNDTVQLYEVATGRLIASFTGVAATLSGTSLGIGRLAFSPDGQQLAITSYSQIRIWDIRTNALVRTLEYNDDRHRNTAIRSIVYSPDGKWLASGSGDITSGARKVTTWHVFTGKSLWTVEGHERDVDTLAFSPNGEILATGSGDKTIKLWDAKSGSLLGTLQGHRSPVRVLAFSPNGKRLLSGGENGLEGVFKLWDVAAKKELRTFGKADGVSGVSVNAIDFAPDGETVAVSGDDIEIWNLSAGKISSRLEGKSTLLYSAAFSPNGDQLAIAYGGWTTALWDLTKPQGPFVLRDEAASFFLPFVFSSGIRFPAYSPDGKVLADGTAEHTIKLWDTTTGKQHKTLSGHTEWAWSEAFSPDGKLLASAGDDKSVRLWDVASGKQQKVLQGHPAPVNIVAFSPDGKLLASGGDDSVIKLWNVNEGTEARTLTGHRGSVRSIAFSADGSTLGSIATDGTIRLWDVEMGKEKAGLSYTSGLFGDVSSGFGIFAEAVRTIAFSPDGKILASGFGSTAIGLWDTATGKPIRALEGHTSSVGSVAFSPDGKWLVSVGADRQIKLWDVTSGKELCSLIVLDPYSGDWAVVTPDGRFDTNNLDRVESLHWVLPEEPFTPIPLEIFMRDYYEPRLLARLLAGETLRPIANLSTVNRTQAQVSINAITPQANADDVVTVTVEVVDRASETQRDARGAALRSGVYDVRVFRNGQLVGYSPTAEGAVNLTAGRAKLTFPVRLPRNIPYEDGKQRVEFSAYAFNSDRVKSDTARRVYEVPPRPLVIGASGTASTAPRAYLITVGVNAYENPDWNLRYAANDARQIQRILVEKLSQGGEYQEVVPVSLISDYQTKNGQNIVNEKVATKANIRAVLDLLAGKQVDPEVLKSIPNADKLRKAGPDDLVIISFSSHGYADNQGNFYFIPYDVGADSKREITSDLLRHCISSEELSLWLRDVDAGEMVMIVDACHSAASVQGEGFKPGPMGSRGLGQLSYDKGIRILTSTQSDDVALETDFTQQGLLSYALTHDGIEAGEADFKPRDKVIMLTEWLEYAADRVPKLYREIETKYQSLALNELRNINIGPGTRTRLMIFSRDGNNSSMRKGSNQQPSLFDFTRKKREVVLATMK